MYRPALWLSIGATGTALVLALFLVIVVRNVGEMGMLRDQSALVEHTREVQRELDAVLIAASEVDAGVRAYVLTGLPAGLEQFREAQREADERVTRLASLTADNPAQQERVAGLRRAVLLRGTLLDRVIEIRRTGTQDAALAEARAADTGAVREEIRAVIAAMEEEESRLLASRRVQADAAYRRSVSGRVGSGIISAALLVGIMLIAVLHARSKAQREEALIQSERRAREAAAREQEARADAERANREKDQFLAVLSHELRTPLNAVLGWTQILQAAGPDDPTIVRALSSIRRNAEAQQRLVEDLLDVSRIITGKLPFEREPMNLRVAISAAVESIRPSAETKGITLTACLDHTAATVGDAGRLQQVACNLLSNAVKFTHAGGHVRVRLEDIGEGAMLEVADDGEGLPPDLQPLIFERFRQGDSTTTRQHGGLGLGLAIAKHIVEAHGGSIGVESAGLNSGAVFRVRLPYG